MHDAMMMHKIKTQTNLIGGATLGRYIYQLLLFVSPFYSEENKHAVARLDRAIPPLECASWRSYKCGKCTAS
jgi:hypothetical protein